MLVLTRHSGESIVLPGLGITITPFDFRGDKVRIAIDAPKHIKVHRLEIWERIRQLKPEAQANHSTEIDREAGAA